MKNKVRVIIADDNKEFCHSLKAALEKESFLDENILLHEIPQSNIKRIIRPHT